MLTHLRWDETSDEDSASMDQSNSEDETYSDHNRRPRRQVAVATKKQQAKRKTGRRKNYSSESESDDDHKRCVRLYECIVWVSISDCFWLFFVCVNKIGLQLVERQLP